MSGSAGRKLSRREFDAVIRRAAELSSADADSVDGQLTEGELFRIAGEVGLSELHVRRALSEVRGVEAHGGPLDRLFGPAKLTAVREVAGESKELTRQLDEFLVGSQLLQSVRRGPGLLQYRPAVDWASQIARAASFQTKKYYVASAKSVEIQLTEVAEGRTVVELVVDPGTRGDNLAGAVFGGGAAGVATGFGVGFALATVAPIGVAVGAAVVVGAGLTGAITYATGIAHKKKLGEVQTELEGVLDTLEMGEPLEPPPASWRRWVKRHFHGVARDLMRADNEVD